MERHDIAISYRHRKNQGPGRKHLHERNDLEYFCFRNRSIYSPKSVGTGKTVKLKVSFIDSKGRVSEDAVEGKVHWQSKFRGIYLIGIFSMKS